MDKKQKLINNFFDSLRLRRADIDLIVEKFPAPLIHFKEDGSPVTDLDLELSKFFEHFVGLDFREFTFYSEENHSAWDFPLLTLDPLDGTREYIDGNPEWAISVGLFLTPRFEGRGWVYNPALQELFESAEKQTFAEQDCYIGEVSRSEWKRGLFAGLQNLKFPLRPVGSIAYKLARLSKAKCDYVISLTPKSIWDIAGGTLLCQDAGIKFYSRGEKVTSVQPFYHPPLIWCHEELFPELSKIYF